MTIPKLQESLAADSFSPCSTSGACKWAPGSLVKGWALSDRMAARVVTKVTRQGLTIQMGFLTPPTVLQELEFVASTFDKLKSEILHVHERSTKMLGDLTARWEAKIDQRPRDTRSVDDKRMVGAGQAAHRLGGLWEGTGNAGAAGPGQHPTPAQKEGGSDACLWAHTSGCCWVGEPPRPSPCAGEASK